MGTACSNINDRDDPDHAEKDQTERPRSRFPKIVKTNPHKTHQSGTITDSDRSKMSSGKKSPSGHWDTVSALDEIAKETLKSRKITPGEISTALDGYDKERNEILDRERALAFEWQCTNSATPDERKADRILQMLRSHDDSNVYANAEKRKGFRGQEHPRLAGDHFLSNKPLIDRTKLFKIAKQMPKGAHLHIHFNACLEPGFLLNVALKMDNMFISSDIQLKNDDDQSFNRSKIQFHILKNTNKSCSLFEPGYSRGSNPVKAMKFMDFLTEVPLHFSKFQAGSFSPVDWLKDKLIFHEEEAHDSLQTVHGAWEEFNTRTQMMKGLFNYERAYREYTRSCLQDFVDDNIQYAEIRPNFMATNQVWRDDGSSQMDNIEIMEMIIEEYKTFKQANPDFGGLKVIYCCPRSYSRELVKAALDECLDFSMNWPEWIAGFDLVGEEAKGHPLHYFIPEFQYFQQKCELNGVNIPFLFHCGETLEMGNDTDNNLVDALLLKSKRIGHGFALARHPYIMERMKKENICLEVCPISNEVLGLTPRTNGHSMYNLLANNVHCTVNSDNGTLFNSTLSHDFYQVMVGKSDMTLFGWKQLIQWSLKHACMSPAEYDTVYANWEKRWEKFVAKVVAEYAGELETYEASKMVEQKALQEKEVAEHEALVKKEQEDLKAAKRSQRQI